MSAPTAIPPAPAGRLLALQRSAGNHATAALLQRNGGKDGDGTATVAPPKEKEEGEKKAPPEAEGLKELELDIASDAELKALPEVVATAATSGPAPAKVAKTKVRAIVYAPFTGHRDKGLAELNEEGGTDDPQARLALLEEKLDAAVAKANELHGPEAPDTLRVFLAPEWFFTGKEGDKPYTLAQVHEVVEGLETISERHPDVVLAPGSIRWARPEPEKAPWPPQRGRKTMWERVFGASEPEPEQPVEALFNSAVILHGGEMKFMYHKQHEGTDYGGGPPGTRQAFVNEVEERWAFSAWQQGKPEAGTAKPGSEPEPTTTANALRRAGAPSNLFTIEGVDFAIDICADFGRGTALREYIDTRAKGEGVDVHLVMAAGIAGQLSPPTTVARVGGYTILAEGGAMQSKPEGRTKVGKVTERTGTLEEASRGYSARDQTVKVEEQTGKQFVEPERKDLVIFDDVLVLPPRPPGKPSPQAADMGAQ